MENNTNTTNDWTIGDHLENFNNPHEVTKEQVGLGNVENVRQYSELNPPPNHINTVCGKGPDANGDIDLVKGDVNLGKVDNVKQYSEKNPPPYPVTSVNGMTGDVVVSGGDDAALNTHLADVSNPHGVTKAQVGLGNVPDVVPYHAGNKPSKADVGLGNVNNTSDAEKPISTATQAALDTKLNASDYVPCDCTQVEEDLAQHVGNMVNPHSVTKAQVGLGNVPDVVPYHAENKPTKADVGLGNVDNTADLSKPVSAAMQTALNAKLNATAYTAADVLNKIKTVDGAGSGLDADLLDGRNAANAANSIPILNASGKLGVAQLPTGTTASTVSLGNHAHSNYAASSHSHSYLPLAGGTVTGTTNFTGALRKSGLDVATMKTGTWTPQAKYLVFSTVGNYTRSGNIVTVSYKGKITNRNTSADELVAINGLPFVSKAGGCTGQFSYHQGNTYLNKNKYTPVTNLTAYSEGNSLYLSGWGWDGRSWLINYVHLYWSNSEVNFSVTYQIA